MKSSFTFWDDFGHVRAPDEPYGRAYLYGDVFYDHMCCESVRAEIAKQIS